MEKILAAIGMDGAMFHRTFHIFEMFRSVINFQYEYPQLTSQVDHKEYYWFVKYWSENSLFFRSLV